MNKEEQKCKDAGYINCDVDADSLKDIEITLTINGEKFKSATILRLTRYMPPPLRVTKTCFTLHKPGYLFMEICIDENDELEGK